MFIISGLTHYIYCSTLISTIILRVQIILLFTLIIIFNIVIIISIIIISIILINLFIYLFIFYFLFIYLFVYLFIYWYVALFGQKGVLLVGFLTLDVASWRRKLALGLISITPQYNPVVSA